MGSGLATVGYSMLKLDFRWGALSGSARHPAPALVSEISRAVLPFFYSPLLYFPFLSFPFPPISPQPEWTQQAWHYPKVSSQMNPPHIKLCQTATKFLVLLCGIVHMDSPQSTRRLLANSISLPQRRKHSLIMSYALLKQAILFALNSLLHSRSSLQASVLQRLVHLHLQARTGIKPLRNAI
jgi:hypothetical protein